MAVARQEILVGAAHRAGQQLVAHRPAVDEEILVLAGRPVERRQAGEAGQPEAFAVGVDRHGIVGELAAHDGGQPLQPRASAIGSDWRRQRTACAPRSPAGRRRPGWAMARRRIASATWLDSVRGSLRNLSRAGVAKKRSRTSTRVPGGCAAGLGSPLAPPSIARLPGAVGAGRPRGDGEAARPRRSTATPRRGKPRVRMWARSSSGSLEVQCRSTASASSSGDMPTPSSTTERKVRAAFLERHRDALRAGIDGVLHQLLHGAGRPLDHLAGGDLVDQGGGKSRARSWRRQSTTSAFGKDTGGRAIRPEGRPACRRRRWSSPPRAARGGRRGARPRA